MSKRYNRQGVRAKLLAQTKKGRPIVAAGAGAGVVVAAGGADSGAGGMPGAAGTAVFSGIAGTG